MNRPRSLRSILTICTVGMALLSLIAVIALQFLTTALHRTTATVGAAVESVRLFEGAEKDLLMFSQAREPSLKREIEQTLRSTLADTNEHISSPGEARLLESALSEIGGYLERSHDPATPADELLAAQRSAHAALDALVTLNVAQARAAQQRAARWDDVGNALGISVTVLLVGVTAAVAIWLNGRAFQPVLGLARAMQRFARGDREARAEEVGPSELREMSARFNEMASALDVQRQAQLSFLGGIAHDLRGPLTPLTMSIDAIALHASPEQRHPLDIAERQLARLQRMIADVLEVTKIQAGQLELRLQVEDLRVLVRNTVEASATPDRVSVCCPDEPVRVRCDALRIEQVIGNLISNALKYSPPTTLVAVDLTAEDREAAMHVTDRGTGISEADVPRLFEPFRRVGTQEVPGTGLGLFVVRRIVEAHHGRIQVTSEPGFGSTFSVFLPLEPANAEVAHGA